MSKLSSASSIGSGMSNATPTNGGTGSSCCGLCPHLHKGLSAGSRVKAYNISNGLCLYCGQEEDIEHIFLHCPRAKRYRQVLNDFCLALGFTTLSIKEILIGESYRLEVGIW
ncbi:hypothetical protein KP509_17G011500 [Ceratopteris richardii]|uniref:Reverse transcriptase zinc-binding domain-containing protein n=1 Tax=Ceratopteris richardii TaxID=49495 RepID=A0A8T2STN3_CERRI|nr:hypothetical protein KP509_17G011500 [Ceratopteris richardii]